MQGLSEQDEAVMAQSVDQYKKAAIAYREYIETYPNEPASYEMNFFYAEALWYSGDHVGAAPVYQQVATHKHHNTYRETAAWSMLKAYEKEMQTLSAAGQFDIRFVPGSDWEPPLPPEDEEASAELKQITHNPVEKDPGLDRRRGLLRRG